MTIDIFRKIQPKHTHTHRNSKRINYASQNSSILLLGRTSLNIYTIFSSQTNES